MLAALILIFTAAGAAFSSLLPDGQDGVNFVLGVSDYDVVFHQPHFPGYPVYMAAGKLLNVIAASPETALTALSIMSAIGSVALVFTMTAREHGPNAGVVIAAALAFHPLFFPISNKIYSEAFGGALLLSAFFALNAPSKAGGARWFIASALAALALGARLSWWPYTLALVTFGAFNGKFKSALSGAASGIAAWLVPQIAVTGAGDLFDAGAAHVTGHFTEWGGAASAAGMGLNRALTFAKRLAEVMGFTGGVTDIARVPWMIIAAIASAMAWRNKNFSIGAAGLYIAATLFYLAWIFIGQNVGNTRHFYPAVFAVVMLAAPLVAAGPKAAMAAAIMMWLAMSADLAAREHNDPPVARFHEWINSSNISDAAYFCGPAERFFDLYPAKAPVASVKRAAELGDVMDSQWPRPGRFVVCGDIPGLGPVSARPLAVFETRRGDPLDRTLKIYAIKNDHAGRGD